MHRPRPTLLLALVLATALAGVGLVTLAGVPSATARAAAPSSTLLAIHMSDRDGGEPMRTFISTTTQVYAVVTHEGARNESYQVRLRDLVGIEVFNSGVRLDGDGRISKAIAVSDFVASYRARAAEERQALGESLDKLADLCARQPGAPAPTPGVTPGVPTSTPDPFVSWRAFMLDALVSAKSTAAEFDRTLQGLGALPDVQAMSVAHADLAAAQQALIGTVNLLDRAERALNQGGSLPGTPTPNPPQGADPAAACAAVADAQTQAAEALARSAAAMAAVPADVSSWRFGATTALYVSGRFQSCQPYYTELFDPALDTSATASPWTIGQPGAPALTFPSAEEVDQVNLGQLGLRLPEGGTAIYASTVTVAGVNHSARVSAFVTDAQCIPVDGVTMTFGVDPSYAGTVSPREVVISNGEAGTTLTAGISATLGSEVTGTVCEGVACQGRPDTTGRKQFSVIGPVETLVLKVHPNTINRLLDQRANISIRALDANARNVADGTTIELRINPGDPGVLARDVQPQGAREPEPEKLGKTVTLLTRVGYGQILPGSDPGIAYDPNPYLLPDNDGDGLVKIVAASDGKTEDANVLIETRWMIFIPTVHRGFVFVNGTATPRPTRAVPTPTPFF